MQVRAHLPLPQLLRRSVLVSSSPLATPSPAVLSVAPGRTRVEASRIRSLTSGSNNQNPQLDLVAKRIFATLQSDPRLASLCVDLSTKLVARGIIDPSNPTRKPSSMELLRIMMDKEIVGPITQIVNRLKEMGVLNDETVRALKSQQLQQNGGSAGVLGSLLAGFGSMPNAAPVPAVVVNPAERSESVKKPSLLDAIKNLDRSKTEK
ncbi:hypothetical protein HDU84_006126 [Entophlyctis sp. JEL0112]|nr:hypothetical protein HDU84_006126 [Entophlyctis sp. JEL0112]